MTRKTTTKKPSQLDRIETKLGAMDAFVSTTLAAMFNEFRTMESKLDAIEAKLKGSEIGEKEEPWMVGDLVTVSPYVSYGPIQGKTMPIRDIDAVQSGFIGMTMPDGSRCSTRAENITRATPAEVQKYEEQVKAQEQEAKIAKLKFGTRVEYEDDRGWKVAMDKPTPDGLYVIVKEGHARMAWAKASQLTLIDP